MTARSFLVLFVSAVCMAIANLLMRGGLLRLEGQFSLSLGGMLSLLRQPLYVSGIALVGVAGILWCRILSTDRLTVSYPLFVSLTYVLITVGAMYFFNERMSYQKWMGAGLILLGMLMLTR